MSLKDYQLLQNHEQYVQTLKECGFNEEEIQFKLEREGYITKVSSVCTRIFGPLIPHRGHSLQV